MLGELEAGLEATKQSIKHVSVHLEDDRWLEDCPSAFQFRNKFYWNARSNYKVEFIQRFVRKFENYSTFIVRPTFLYLSQI